MQDIQTGPMWLKSSGKIKDVVAKEMVDEMTRLVLVNALYFRGTWDKPFSKTGTSDDEFKINKVKYHQNKKTQ